MDVPDWAEGYVGYAYTNGITDGMGPNTFGPSVQLSDNMFLTLVLRALGYSDKGEKSEFTWDKPYELAKKVGLVSSTVADKSFTRGDAVIIFWNALNAKLVGEDVTLAQSLIKQGIFTAEQFAEAGVIQKLGMDDVLETDDDLLPSISDKLPEIPSLGDPGGEGPPELEEDVFE